MLRLAILRGTSKDNPIPALEALIKGLGEEWNALLTPAVAAQAQVLGIKPPRLARSPFEDDPWGAQRPHPYTWAEVLVYGNTLLTITVRDERSLVQGEIGRPASRPERGSHRHALDVYSIGNQIETPELHKLKALIEEAVSVNLRPFHYQSRRFSDLLEEGRKPPPAPSATEVEAARILVDKATRVLAIAVKSSSGLLMSDAPKQVGEDRRSGVSEIIRTLLSKELVTKETVVVCQQTGTQVARMPSADLLPDLDEKGLRCPCGRTLSNERCEEALSITPAGVQLLDGSRWFTVVVVDELMRFGVPIEHILIDQESGGDEVDCIAVISGNMVLFELKDKTFSLGNAYSFGAKIGIMQPDISVIVTTDHVGNDAKAHFERARAAADSSSRRPTRLGMGRIRNSKPVYIEGLGSMRPTLEQILTTTTTDDVTRLLAAALPFAAITPAIILERLGQGR